LRFLPGGVGVVGEGAVGTDLSAQVFSRYQGFVDNAYNAALNTEAAGLLRIPEGISRETYLGQYTDKIARAQMRDWVTQQGISEGAEGLVQVNRRLYNPVGEGYRVPDVRIPEENIIFEGTIGQKSFTTPQIRDFYDFSQGGRITIIRPTELGGSYSVLPTR